MGAHLLDLAVDGQLHLECATTAATGSKILIPGPDADPVMLFSILSLWAGRAAGVTQASAVTAGTGTVATPQTAAALFSEDDSLSGDG